MTEIPEASPIGHQDEAPGLPVPEAPEDGHLELFEMVDPNEPASHSRAVGDPAMRNWFRTARSVGTDARNAAMLCLASDMTLVSAAWRPHDGLAVWDMERVQAHSLTFTCYFHGVTDLSRWHLLDAASSVAGAGRSLSHGSWFDDEGRLVASVAMDAVMRLRQPGPDD